MSQWLKLLPDEVRKKVPYTGYPGIIDLKSKACSTGNYHFIAYANIIFDVSENIEHAI
jgi:hypothetical protein